MIPRDFFFSAFSHIWHLLWLIPLLSLFLYAHYQRKKGLEKLVAEPLKKSVLVARDPFWNTLAFSCFILGWILAVIAWMGPMGNEYYMENEEKVTKEHAPLEIFLVIDTSQSMAVQDGRGKQTRLGSATEIADRLVAKLKTDPVALFAFTSELVPFVPLTYDRTFVRLMLKELQLNEGDHYGTNFSIAFEQLTKQLFEAYPKAPKAIVLFSDGGDLIIEATTDKANAIADLMKIVKNLNVPVFAVGIGSIEGGEVPDVGKKVISRLDEPLLREISQQTGGRYFSGDSQSSEEVAARINQSLERPRINEGAGGVVSTSKGLFRYYFQIPLVLALAFLGLSFFMPRSRAFVFFFMIALNGFAVDPGEALYEAGQYKQASEWFAGELKHLPPEWLRNKLFYNLGTSLMAEKKWKEASRAFFAVSKEAYAYPLFRLRLLYNQIIALHKQGKNVVPLIQWIDLPALNELKIDESKEKVDPLVLFRLASLLQKPSPLLASALADLPPSEEVSLAKKALEENHLDQATFYLTQFQLKTASSPTVFLEAGLDALAVASAISNNQEGVAKNASRFYPLVLEWQTGKYAEGICQCSPWNEVLPRFTEGLKMLEQKPFEKQIFYAYEKWLEALEKLHEEVAPTKEEEKPEESDVRELREMQTLDKQPSKAKMKPVGGMPW